MAESETIFHFLDELLGIPHFPDYSGAQNGLQVEAPAVILRVAIAVDASEAVIAHAVSEGVDLLMVHHGLYWDGLRPLTGRSFRRVAPLIRHGAGLYAAHLPLDAHSEVGNCALLLRALGLEPSGRFMEFQGESIGWTAETEVNRETLLNQAREAVAGEARLIPGGPELVRRVGVLTGGGGSEVAAAAAAGLDTLITGEAPHHAYLDAMEYGVNLILAGHYATETFGVRALGELLEKRFGVESIFLDHPTGL